jgi:hypothetical protein
MKTLYTLTFLFFYAITVAQTDSSKIQTIRKNVEKINKDTSYIVKTFDNEQFLNLNQMPDGGGDLRGYFKNGQLVKIIERIGFSSCVNTTEYYVQDDKLIFVYIQGREFLYVDSLATFDGSKQNVTMECRYYFQNGKLLKSILNGSTHCSGAPLDSWTKQIQDDYLEYAKLFKKK